MNVYVYIYICMYVYIYTYTYTHLYNFDHRREHGKVEIGVMRSSSLVKSKNRQSLSGVWEALERLRIQQEKGTEVNLQLLHRVSLAICWVF